MVHTTFNPEYHFGTRSSRQVELSSNLYQVVIKCRANESRAKFAWAMPSAADIAKNGEDGEYIEYEIEADSHSEASAKAEALAADSFVDISYIEVYLIH